MASMAPAAVPAPFLHQFYVPPPLKWGPRLLHYYPERRKFVKDFFFRTPIPEEFDSEEAIRKWFSNDPILSQVFDFARLRFKNSDLLVTRLNTFSGRNAFHLLIFAKGKAKWRLAAFDQIGIDDKGRGAEGFHVAIEGKALLITNAAGQVAKIDFTGAEKALSLLSKTAS